MEHISVTRPPPKEQEEGKKKEGQKKNEKTTRPGILPPNGQPGVGLPTTKKRPQWSMNPLIHKTPGGGHDPTRKKEKEARKRQRTTEEDNPGAAP